MSYALQHLKEAAEIIQKMDVAAIEKMADLLATVKSEGGRVFFLGVGGSAGNCGGPVDCLWRQPARCGCAFGGGQRPRYPRLWLHVRLSH